jgi:chorismate--pyruvate lyase
MTAFTLPPSRTLPSTWLSRIVGLHGAQRDWLRHPGSLTARLKRHCDKFAVSPLKTRLARAHLDERGLLELHRPHYAYVREVLLKCDDRAVVFAHSVIPRPHLRGPWNQLTRLGCRPLGETLFANPRIRRTSLAFCKLAPHHPLQRRIREYCPDAATQLWARRSQFSLQGRSLMVTEVFIGTLTRP